MFRFIIILKFVVSRKIAANVLQIDEVADLEALTFNLALMFILKANVQFSTEPTILPNCCYRLWVLVFLQ
jgi:hypothetical protein